MQESRNTGNPKHRTDHKCVIKLGKGEKCVVREYSRWDFEPEDYVVVGHREVTDKEKKEAEELLKRAF